MAEALNVPRPVSVVAVDGAAVDNVRSDADRTQVPFHFSFLTCHFFREGTPEKKKERQVRVKN